MYSATYKTKEDLMCLLCCFLLLHASYSFSFSSSFAQLICFGAGVTTRRKPLNAQNASVNSKTYRNFMHKPSGQWNKNGSRTYHTNRSSDSETGNKTTAFFQVPTQKSLGYLLMAKGTTPHLRVVLLITVRAFQSPSALSVKGEHPL